MAASSFNFKVWLVMLLAIQGLSTVQAICEAKRARLVFKGDPFKEYVCDPRGCKFPEAKTWQNCLAACDRNNDCNQWVHFASKAKKTYICHFYTVKNEPYERVGSVFTIFGGYCT